MPNLNLVQLMGNLTRQPEVKFTPKGTAFCDFGMAINRVYTANEEKKEEVTFVDIEFWGKQAETLGEYVKKGDPLYVSGRLRLDQWEDKQTGQKRSKLRVVGESFQFLKGKGDSTGRQPRDEDAEERAPRHSSHTGKAPLGSDAPLDLGDGHVQDEDFPFRSILAAAFQAIQRLVFRVHA